MIGKDKASRRTVVLMTTTHLCKNPRLVKEISTFSDHGYALHVVYFQFLPDLVLHDEEIEANFPLVTFRVIRWLSFKHPERFAYTLMSKILRSLRKRLNISILPELQLWSGWVKLSKIVRGIPADLYHAHNPGALSVAVNVAKRVKKKAGFDAEDYHRGESHENIFEKALIIELEEKFIPQLDLFITSSPLIKQEYQKHYPQVDSLCLLNVFPSTQKKNISDPLSTDHLNCIWFSQTVGLNRGLTSIIKAINLVSTKPIQLDIIGHASLSVRTNLETLLTNENHKINFLGTISPSVLDTILPRYDIGIASEPGKDLNNSFALSNKLFSYIKAGLAVLLSDTPAQRLFFEALSDEIGLLYSNENFKTIADRIQIWIDSPKLLSLHKKNSLQLCAKALNWELEQIKLIETIKRILCDVAPEAATNR